METHVLNIIPKDVAIDEGKSKTHIQVHRISNQMMEFDDPLNGNHHLVVIDGALKQRDD